MREISNYTDFEWNIRHRLPKSLINHKYTVARRGTDPGTAGTAQLEFCQIDNATHPGICKSAMPQWFRPRGIADHNREIGTSIMAVNPLARFIATYHGDRSTLKNAITRMALSEHREVLRKFALPWNPRADFNRELKRIALRSVPLSVPRYMNAPAARICKKLEIALGIETQEMLDRRTREEALVDREAWRDDDHDQIVPTMGIGWMK